MDKRARKQNTGHPSSTTEDQGRQNGSITDMTKQSTENLVFHEKKYSILLNRRIRPRMYGGVGGAGL